MGIRYKTLVMVEDPARRDLIESALDVSEFSMVHTLGGKGVTGNMVEGDFHIAFLDLPRSGLRDDSTFRALGAGGQPVPCIIVAGEEREQEAVDAVAEGAFDYVLSSDSVHRVRVAAGRAVAQGQSKAETLAIRSMLRQTLFSLEPAGTSVSIIKVKSLIDKAAGTEGNVIIEGEARTGKRNAARTIHSLCARQGGPFVEVSCSLVPESLVESEFFGRETGIYGQGSRLRKGRIEQADGGTLYLEDMERLSPNLQRRLLGAIRTGEVERAGDGSAGTANTRFIAAAGDLEAAVYSGKFSKELYEALGSVRIKMPELKDRRDDIPLLLTRYMGEFAAKLGNKIPGIERPAMARLLEHSWPGNLEELSALAEGLVRRHSAATVTVSDLPANIRLGPVQGKEESIDIQGLLSSTSLPEAGIRLPSVVDNLEKALIIKALDRTGGLQTEAARLLGLKRTTLLEKIKKKGIS